MPAQRKYPPELIERAVRLVADKQRETPKRPGIIREVGAEMGSLRSTLENIYDKQVKPKINA